jgi:hypothetical protein
MAGSSITRLNPQDLAWLPYWLNTQHALDTPLITELIYSGQLHCDVSDQGLIIYQAQFGHAEWLTVVTDKPVLFIQQRLKGWLKRHGFNSMHWPLPETIWSWHLPKTGYSLTAQAALTLDVQNPVNHTIFQHRLAQLPSLNKSTYALQIRYLHAPTADLPLWHDIANCLYQAYATSPDMDWLPAIRQNPYHVLQQQLTISAQTDVVLSFYDNQLAGCCLFFKQGDQTVLGFWAVKPAFKGSGQWLLVHALKQIMTKTNRVSAYTNTRLSSVIRAYQSFGFALTANQTIAYCTGNNPPGVAPPNALPPPVNEPADKAGDALN